MSEKSSTSGWVIASLIVALLGIGVPIIWDIYKSKSLLELDLISKSAVVSRSENIDGLKILFRDQPVQNLTRYDFILTNSGKIPISEKDVVEKPTISFGANSLVLDAIMKNVSPKNLKAECEISATKTATSIAFPLLNSGDSIHFSLLVDGTSPQFTAAARIANIRELSFRDRTKESDDTKPRLRTTFYIASGFTIFFTATWIAGIFGIRAHRRAFSNVRMAFTDLPAILTKDDIVKLWVKISPDLKTLKLENEFLKEYVSKLADDRMDRDSASEVLVWLEVRLKEKNKSDRTSAATFMIVILLPAYIYLGNYLLNYYRA